MTRKRSPRAFAGKCRHFFEQRRLDMPSACSRLQPRRGALNSQRKRRKQPARAALFERARGVGQKRLSKQK